MAYQPQKSISSYDKDIGKNYLVNNINIHCPSYIKGTDSDGNIRILSEDEKLCDLLNKLSSSISYNTSRMKKLHDEYKCSAYYSLTTSNDKRPMPNCQDPVYDNLTQKFSIASKAIGELNSQISSNNFNTHIAKIAAQNVVNSLDALKIFTAKNLPQVNAAFEEAHYDTNTAGVATAFASLFMPFLGLPIAVANQHYNNEFDGKIDRAYDSAVEVSNRLTAIGDIVSHHHSDIYV